MIYRRVLHKLVGLGLPESFAVRAIRRMPATSGVVLMYHEVQPDEVTLPAWTVVRESDFKWQMQFLQQHFDVITLDQALERTAGKHVAARPFAVVTFDDGYRGNLDTALPVMETLGLPLTVYVATQAVVEGSLYWYDQIINLLNCCDPVEVDLVLGGRAERFRISNRGSESSRWKEVQRLLSGLKRLNGSARERVVRDIAGRYPLPAATLEMLSPDQLRTMASSTCLTIGSHTHRHELLDQLKQEEVRETIETAHVHLTQIIGYQPRHFSYPNGNFSNEIQEVVREAGYISAVTTINGAWSGQDDPLMIPRVAIGRFETRTQFRARISGFFA